MSHVNLNESFNFDEEAIAKIRSGDWEVHGAQIRDRITKTVRGVAKVRNGVEINRVNVPVHPQLSTLQSAMSIQQILGMVVIAQNAAIARNLGEIEVKLDAINERLANVESRLPQIASDAAMTRIKVFSQPLTKLSAAKNIVSHAGRHRDTTSLIAATGQIEEAGWNLLNAAEILVCGKQDNLPAFMFARTVELGELVSNAANAFLQAADLHIRLNGRDIALTLLGSISRRVESLMILIKTALTNDDFLADRAAAGLDSDDKIQELGKLMTKTLHELIGKAMFIEFDDKADEIQEDVNSALQEIQFIQISRTG